MLRDIVTKGSTDRSVPVNIIDATTGVSETGVAYNTSGLEIWYRREGAAVVNQTTMVSLAALTTAHTDWGFLKESGNTYRVDLPDAAFATGANYVDYGGVCTGMEVIGGRVRLVDVDLEDAVRGGMTALPNAAADAAGGLAISDAGGLDLDAKLAATNEVTAARMGALTDWLDGGRLDLLLDAIKAVTDVLPDSGALTSLATASALATVDTNVDAILVDTGTTLPATLAALNDLSSADVTAAVPTVAQVADGVWDEAKAGHVTAGSFGEEVQAHALSTEVSALNDLDSTAVQTAAAAALTAYDPPTKAELDSGLAALNDPTAAAIADAVWDEAKAGHVGAGSFGEEVQAHALSAEVSALNDLDSSAVQTAAAAALTAYDPPTKAELDAGLAALNDLDAAAVRTAIGLATANLDTQIATLATAAALTTVDTVVDGIKAVTDVLPDSGALTSLATAAALATVDGIVDSIKTVTDALTAAAAAKLALSTAGIVSGAAVSGTLSTTEMTTDLTEATDGHYIGGVVVWTSGVLAGQRTDITAYDGTTKKLTFTGVTEAPGAGDTFVIV